MVERDDGVRAEKPFEPLLHVRVVRRSHGCLIEKVREVRTTTVQLEAVLI